MDIYHSLDLAVPQLLFTVLYQAGPTVSEAAATRTVTALHLDQAQTVGEELHRWLERQYAQRAGKTISHLQHLSALSAQEDLEQVQQAVLRDYRQLGKDISTQSVWGMQGSAEEAFREEVPSHPDLARRFADGREYQASLGFKSGQGFMHETRLLFRDSVHYDSMEHIMRDRMGIYQGSHGAHIQNVTRTMFRTYNLIHQLGEPLTAGTARDSQMQEVTFAFNKGPIQYSPFRQEVTALMEDGAGKTSLAHASFWQRKLGLGTGKEFVLRLRLPAGEAPLLEIISVIAGAGRVGKETVVKRGKLLLGKRVL